jgi:hypothetical protein
MSASKTFETPHKVEALDGPQACLTWLRQDSTGRILSTFVPRLLQYISFAQSFALFSHLPSFAVSSFWLSLLLYSLLVLTEKT